MFTINGESWQVVLVPNNHFMLTRRDGSQSVGACDDPTKTIYISDQIENELFKKVLCHEITHAAMFSYNVDLTIEQEEILAELIATYGAEIIAITNTIISKIQNRTMNLYS